MVIVLYFQETIVTFPALLNPSWDQKSIPSCSREREIYISYIMVDSILNGLKRICRSFCNIHPQIQHKKVLLNPFLITLYTAFSTKKYENHTGSLTITTGPKSCNTFRYDKGYMPMQLANLKPNFSNIGQEIHYLPVFKV